MSMRDIASGKTRHATRRLVALGTAFAAALGVAVAVGGPAYASGENCSGTVFEANTCITVNGYSNVINSIKAESTTNFRIVDSNLNVVPGHIQLTDPTGRTLCNSSTVTLNIGAYMTCSWNGGGVAHGTGQYCVTLWAYKDGDYKNEDQECLVVFK